MSSGVYILVLGIFKTIFCTWIGLYTDRSELKPCIVCDSATKLLFTGVNFTNILYHLKSIVCGDVCYLTNKV